MAVDSAPAALDAIHHVAITVSDVAAAVEWYTRRFQCRVSYQDESWAMLEFANLRIALVVSAQHPAHLGFTSTRAESFGPLKTHRDGSRSTYITDPAGNTIEILDARSV